MMASKGEAVTLDTETIRHDGKPTEMTDPREGTNLAMTMAHTVAATKTSIAPLATTMTKGKAPAAMTMIHLHEEQKDGESKRRHDPSPSPLGSPHGGGSGGGRPARSRNSRKDPPDQKPYDARTHLNKIAKSQTAFFVGPKCFGQRIRDEPIPHGFKIEKNICQYNGVDRPLTWL
jgi:hypothetical protein